MNYSVWKADALTVVLHLRGHDIRICTVFLQPYFDTALLCALSDYHVKISYPSISRDHIEGIMERIIGFEPIY